MPFAKIEVRRSRPPEQVQALIEAVYQAQREALQVPEGDRQIRCIEHRLGALGIEPADVFIVLPEPPLDNWGLRGGVPAGETDLGFNLHV